MLFRFLHTSSAKYTTISLPRNRRSYESFSIIAMSQESRQKGIVLRSHLVFFFLLDAEENGKNAVSIIFYLQEVLVLVSGAEVVIVLFAHEIA